MENKKIGSYQLADKIAETNGAKLYRANYSKDIDKEEDFFYAVKEYCNCLRRKGTLKQEKKISHEIENYALKSIVIPILNVIEEGEYEYAIMQFKKNGMFLKDWIETMETTYGTGNIPLEFSLQMIEEILDSLEVLHCFEKKEKQIGYLHLDLHPGNIFLESVDIKKRQVGKAKFIDFFSALKIEEGKPVDAEKKMAIISDYSAPEQLARECYKYGLSTDLFSVGVIFLRMLLGKLELTEDNCLTKEIQENIQHFSENPVMNYAILQFLKCCMEEHPNYRYQNAKEMLCAVEKLKRCYNAYKEQDYYTLFSIAYEMVIPEQKGKGLQSKLNIKNFQNAVIKLEGDLRQNKIPVSKCTYLFEFLWDCLQHQEATIPVNIKWNLLNSGIACYNHTGDNWRTKQLYEEIEKLKSDISLMDYLGYLNRIAVMYADRYEFEQAYEIASKNVNSLEIIKNAYIQVAKENEIIPYEESTRVLHLARTYSAKGTYMVWTKREEPMVAFEQALQEFGDDIGNKVITISHILQYAIEIKDKQLYENYVSEMIKIDVNYEYFHEYKNVKEGLSKILEGEFDRFSLLVFLKGIYAFYMEDVTEECQKKLVQLLQDERLKKLGIHPAQLIYKYIALILYESGWELEDVEEALFFSMTCIEQAKIDLQKPINIMMCMTYQIMWIYNEVTEQEEENEELLLMMKEHAKKSGWDKLYQELEQKGNIKEVLRYEHQ